MQEGPALAMEEDKFRLAIRARDPVAWDRLFREYWPQLRGKARLLLPPHLDPENAVGEVWVRALKAARGYDPRRLPYPWLARICLNVCLNVRRRPVRFLPIAAPEEVPAGDHPQAPVSEEVREALQGGLRKLPSRQREIVILRFFFEVSTQEIALLLRVHPNSVQQSMLRGVRQLRSCRRVAAVGRDERRCSQSGVRA